MELSKEEKEAIELLDFFESDDLVECAMYRNALNLIKNLISKLQKENEKQSKVIDEMTKAWKQDDVRSVEEIKQYFYRKVENDNE